MFRLVWKLIVKTVQIFSESHASRMSAAMTYFTMLSLAPLLMIAIAIAGWVFDNQLAEQEIIEQFQIFTTPEIAKTIGGIIHNATRPRAGLIAGTLSVLVLAYAASGVFAQLHDTLNDIWQVPLAARKGIIYTLQRRLLGFVMVILAAVLLLVSLLMSAILGTISEYLAESWPAAVTWLNLIDRGVAYLGLPLVLSLVYWLVPSTKIRWWDVVPAAMLTSLLIGVSRMLVELYLRFSTTSQVYGTAGSLVIMLVWIYITGLFVFFGAAFSRAWAEVLGSLSEPDSPTPQPTDSQCSSPA